MIERVLPPKKPAAVDRITLHFDGVIYQTPPYPSAWSFLVRLNGEKVYEESNRIPDLPQFSGNDVVAKFWGLHEALRWLSGQDRFDDYIVFMGDNPMIMGSMAGTRLPPDNEKYRFIWSDCRKLAAPFFNIQFVWITKTENRECRAVSLNEIQKKALA